jgi:L-arabinonolactonase
MKFAARCILSPGAIFSECPVWCGHKSVLYWVDINGRKLNRVDPATGINDSWLLPSPIGSFSLRVQGGMLLALQTGFAFLDEVGCAVTMLDDPEPDLPTNRLNDGRCDRQGRFWVGSMHGPGSGPQATGSLWRRTANGQVTSFQGGLLTSNGIAFSPDGKIMYLSDSHPTVRTIWAFDFDCDDGVPYNRRVFVDTRSMPGRPDGAAIDTDGCYWSAAADGWEVIRYTPEGKIDRRIPLPVSQPSCPAFGGHNMRTLFVTSLNFPGLDMARQPDAGGIFAIELDVQGVPEPHYAG